MGRGILLAGVALATIGFVGQAEASDRLSMHEINNFVAKYTNAVNSPGTDIGKRFLQNHVSTTAMFQDNMSAWTDNRYYYQAWNGYGYVSPYYRYPYYNGYAHPTALKSADKVTKIENFERKKSIVPRYHQTMDVLGASISIDAKTAVLDVHVREYGLAYGLAPYGYNYGQKLQHSNARCNLHLTKSNGDVLITKMVCNKDQFTAL